MKKVLPFAGAVLYVVLGLGFLLLADRAQFPFGTSRKILLMAITCLAAAYGWLNLNVFLRQKSGKERKTIACGGQKAGRIILVWLLVSLALALAVVGNYLFLLPAAGVGVPLRLVTFAAAGLWACGFTQALFFVPLGVDAFASVRSLWTDRAGKRNFIRNIPSDKKEKLLFFLAFALVVAGALVMLVAYNPAITSSDTRQAAFQAKGVIPFTSWQAPFYTFLVRLILSLWDNLTFWAMLQILFFAYVVADSAVFLYELSGRKRWYAAGLFAVVFVLLPGNDILLATLWKDIPYTASVLWLTVLLGRLILGYPTRRFVPVQFFAALVFVCLLRQNGIVPFVLIVAVLLVLKRVARNIKVAAAAAVVFVVLFNTVGYAALDIEKINPGGKYIGLGQDLVYVYENGGRIDSETLAIVNGLTENGELGFNPYRANLSYDLETSVPNFVGCYIRTAVANPVKIIKAVLFRMDYVWDIFPGRDFISDTDNFTRAISEVYEDWLEYYPDRIRNALTDCIDSVRAILTKQTFSWIVWRTGWMTWCAVIAGGVALYRKKAKILVLLLPGAGQFLSLLLTTGWSDYRYFWTLGLCFLYFAFAATVYDGLAPEPDGDGYLARQE